MHGGNSSGSRIHGAKILQEQAQRAILSHYASPIDISPEQALLALVREAAGNVAFLGARIDRLVQDSPVIEAAGDGSTLQVLGTAGRFGAYDRGDKLFGPTIAVDRDGVEHTVGEDYRGYLKLYNEEREHLRKVAKDALSAGIEKARVEIAQYQAQTMAQMLNRVLDRMDLDEAKRVVARALMAEEMRKEAARPLEVTR